MDLSRLSPTDSTGSQEGGADYVPPSRTHQYKKLMKPLMERKRRARMNICIEEIRDLIAGQLGRPGPGRGVDADAARAHADDDLVSRMDKAEVLELAVKHIHKQLMASRRPDPYTELKMFHQGYMSARAVISDYLHCSAEADPTVLRRLNSHLDRLGGAASASASASASVVSGPACAPAPLRLLPQPGQCSLPPSSVQPPLPPTQAGLASRPAQPPLPPPPVPVSLPYTRPPVTVSAARPQATLPANPAQAALLVERGAAAASCRAQTIPPRAAPTRETGPRSPAQQRASLAAPAPATPAAAAAAHAPDGPINLSKSAFKPVLSKKSSSAAVPRSVAGGPGDLNWRPW